MANVEFVNTRFDPDLSPMHDLAKQMAGAFGYTADLSIDPALAQLLRLRVAQIADCAYCLTLHAPYGRERAGSERADALSAWRESHLYSRVEKAALEYCEALTDGDATWFAVAHEELAEHMDAKAIAEVAAIVINMNVWTRLKLAQGATPVPIGDDA